MTPEQRKHRNSLANRFQRAADRGNAALAQKLKTELDAFDVITSAHVSEVEVEFLSEDSEARYYAARTFNHPETHEYKLRVWQDEKHGRLISCNCAAGQKSVRTEEAEVVIVEPMLCRHAIMTAVVDSNLTGAPLRFEAIGKYTAH
jgi:hypothetical protein